MLRITVDREKCVGSGNCVFWAPASFDLDDEGISVVLDPVGDTEERVRVAAEGCPSRAITIEDGGTDAGAPAEPTREGHDVDRAVR